MLITQTRLEETKAKFSVKEEIARRLARKSVEDRVYEALNQFEEDEFADVGMHYNPTNCPHPFHIGDLPPLLENNGYAYMSVLINKFKIKDILGKTIIIHDKPDDFTTQPSGNPGTKIACGVIE